MNSNESSINQSSEFIDMVGARFARIVQMGPSDADIVLFRTSMGPGKVVPLHSHIDPECFYVLSGRLEVFLIDPVPQWNTVEAGQSLLVVNGIKHMVRNATKDPVDMVMATNNRLFRFFREAGRSAQADTPLVAPTPDDIQRMIRVSKTFGYWLASPAESAAITG